MRLDPAMSWRNKLRPRDILDITVPSGERVTDARHTISAAGVGSDQLLELPHQNDFAKLCRQVLNCATHLLGSCLPQKLRFWRQCSLDVGMKTLIKLGRVLLR